MALVVDEKRLLEMQDMRKRHFTYRDIAEHFGISHQRVHQILSSPRKRNGKTNIEKIIYEGIYQLFSDDPTMTYRKFAKVVLFSDCNNTAERIYSKGVPLFSKPAVQEEFDDYKPYIVGKEGLLEAISIYQEKVLNWYKSLLVNGEEKHLPFGITLTVEDVKSVDKIIEHIRDKIQSISYRGLANIDEDSKWSVTSSWEYEHSIFNLVHILKSIDWEQDTLLFYGW